MSQEATLLEIRELEADYEILGELGRGGMAVVYLARDRQLGRQVAIKVIHAAAGADEAMVARQLVEARTVAQLQHPNVVAMYAVKRLSTFGLALVMQYVPGRTLERAMREDGTFTPERAEAVLTDIAAALAYAHARGVIHRDIKPDNVFLNDETGRALLSDFGIALSAEAGQQATASDMIVGTPAYMSPEQIDGVELDGRSDLFGLGLIGYEMLAGVRPWIDESISDVMYRQKFEVLPPLADVRPDTSDRLRVAIERTLEKDRDDRWPTAAAFLGALTDDEWVPEDRQARVPGPGDPANRVAAHLGPRGAQTPVSAGAPLQTMQYRRDPDATPRRGMPLLRPAAPPPRSRLRTLIIPALIAAAVAATFVVRPDFLTRLGLDDQRQEGDSVARARAASLTRWRDSVSQAGVLEARRAADSATAAATSAADSSAARRYAAQRDSLIRLAEARDSARRAAADAPRTVAVAPTRPPVNPPAPPPRATRPASRDTATPAPAPPPPAAVIIHTPSPPTVVAGGTHTCALGADGGVSCWGGNDRGQLGIGATTRKSAPTRTTSDVPFEQVAAGIAHSCAVARSGAAYCWGANDYGQLGDSGAQAHLTPTRVAGTHTFRVVATGTTHTCGLTTTGEVWCWGRNIYGQVGDGSTQDRPTPVRVQSSAHFVALTAGWNHSCALDAGGQAYCWGQNASGQLGDGTTIVRAAPTPVTGGVTFRAIAAGGSHTCALSMPGQAYCWGRDNAGQLGIEEAGDRSVPTRVANSLTFVDLTAGGVHSCALARGGDAYCWGRNSYGQLGDGSTSDRPTPVKVQGGEAFIAIHASGAHTCGTATGGATYCWGNNSDGQLGDGTTVDRSLPVLVTGAR